MQLRGSRALLGLAWKSTVVAVALTTLAACGDQDSRGVEEPQAVTVPTDTPVPEPVLPRYAAGAAYGAEALATDGTLSRDGACLYYSVAADDPRESETGLLVLPEGEGAWEEATETLTFEGHEYELGDVLFWATPTLSLQWSWAQAPDPTCDVSVFWVAGVGAHRPSIAGEPPAADPTTRVLTEEESLASDASWYARGFRVPHEQAVQNLTWQSESSETNSALLQVAPERSAGVWTQHLPNFALVASFTGGPEGLEEAFAIAANAPIPVEIRTGAAHTGAELLAALEAASAMLQAEAPPGALAGMGTYLMKGVVGIDVVAGSIYAADTAAFAARLTAEYGVPFEVTVVAEGGGDSHLPGPVSEDD